MVKTKITAYERLKDSLGFGVKASPDDYISQLKDAEKDYRM